MCDLLLICCVIGKVYSDVPMVLSRFYCCVICRVICKVYSDVPRVLSRFCCCLLISRMFVLYLNTFLLNEVP